MMGFTVWLLSVALGTCASLRDLGNDALAADAVPLIHLRGQLAQVAPPPAPTYMVAGFPNPVPAPPFPATSPYLVPSPAGSRLEALAPAPAVPVLAPAPAGEVTTTLSSGVQSGSTTIEVADQSGFSIGDVIKIGDETFEVKGFSSIILDRPVSHDHAAGTTVERVSSATPALTEAEAATSGLEIGTQPGEANVVSGSEVVGTWGSGDDLAASPTELVPATHFFLRTSGVSLVLTKATVSPPRLPHLQTYLVGELATELSEQGKATIRPGEERDLTVSYSCSFAGSTALIVTLEFQDLSPVQIPLTKTCGGVQNTALTVTVNTGGYSEKAVVMGIPKWDELKVVGVRIASATFSVYNDPLSEQGVQVLSTPVASSVGACSAVVDMPEEPKQYSLASGAVLDVPVKYRCFRHGSCVVSLKVPFFPEMAPYQPLRWSWTKVCGGSALGIDVRGEVEKGRETRRLLVSDGAQNKSDAFLPWLVDDDMNTNKVFLINDAVRSLEPEVALRALRVRCLDTARCTARISEHIPKMLSSSSPLQLDVEYSCLTSGSSLVQLMMVTEGHDPVVATWAKDCSAFSDSFCGIFLYALSGCLCTSLACVGLGKCCGDADTADEDLVDAETLAKDEDASVGSDKKPNLLVVAAIAFTVLVGVGIGSYLILSHPAAEIDALRNNGDIAVPAPAALFSLSSEVGLPPAPAPEGVSYETRKVDKFASAAPTPSQQQLSTEDAEKVEAAPAPSQQQLSTEDAEKVEVTSSLPRATTEGSKTNMYVGIGLVSITAIFGSVAWIAISQSSKQAVRVPAAEARNNDYNIFKPLLEDMQQQRHHSDMRSIFDALSEHRGYIDRDRFQKIMDIYDYNLTPEERWQHFSKAWALVRVNARGEMDFEEFDRLIATAEKAIGVQIDNRRDSVAFDRGDTHNLEGLAKKWNELHPDQEGGAGVNIHKEASHEVLRSDRSGNHDMEGLARKWNERYPDSARSGDRAVRVNAGDQDERAPLRSNEYPLGSAPGTGVSLASA